MSAPLRPNRNRLQVDASPQGIDEKQSRSFAAKASKIIGIFASVFKSSPSEASDKKEQTKAPKYEKL